MSLEEIVEVLFYYRFEKVSKSVWQYGIRKIQGKIQGWFARWGQSIKKGS
jgi:hypothetical protein